MQEFGQRSGLQWVKMGALRSAARSRSRHSAVEIGDEEIHRTCIMLEGHQHRGTERGCVADLSIYWITILRILSTLFTIFTGHRDQQQQNNSRYLVFKSN
jgi:hypothetical protein